MLNSCSKVDNAVIETYDNEKDAISEWEYFERLNTETIPYRRFLDHITPIEFIDEVVKRYTK